MSNTELGNRIKDIRKKLGKSQEEFGKLFDPPAPKSAVSRWEHGGSPNKRRLAKIARLGGISVDELINGTLEDAMINILNEAYILYYDFLETIDNGSWEDFVSSKKRGKTDLRNYSSLFSLIKEDSYIPYPITPKNRGALSKNKQDELIRKYYHDNLIAGLEYCGREAIRKAKAVNASPKNKSLLIRFLAEAEEQHFSGETPTNDGVLSVANNGLDDIRNKLWSLTHGLDTTNPNEPHEVVYKTKITPDFLKEINAIIDKAQEDIYTSAEKYFNP